MQTYSLSLGCVLVFLYSLSPFMSPFILTTTLYIPPTIWNPVYHIMCAPLGLENVHRLNPEISRLLSWRQTTEQQHREFNYVLVDIVPPEGANGAPVPDPRFILGFPAAFF